MKVPPLHRDGNKCSLDGAILRRGGHPRATLSSKMRRGGACVPARTSAQRRFHTKNTRIVRGEFNDGCALVRRHGRAHRHRPYPSPSNHTWCALTHCTFDGSKPCGVPSPHRGYTFDSAGLASATQPTLGNNVSEGATHNVGCTFFRHTLTMLRHTLTMLPTTQSGAEMHRALPPPQL